MQKIARFSGNQLVGLLKRQAYRVTVLNNGTLFLKQRTILPEPFQVLVQAVHEPVNQELFEKGMYVVEKTGWTHDSLQILFSMLVPAIENGDVDQASKVLNAAKAIGEKAKAEELTRLSLYFSALSVLKVGDQNIEVTRIAMKEWTDLAASDNKIDPHLQHLLSDHGQDGPIVKEILKFARASFNATWTDKLTQIGALNLILCKYKIETFDDEEKALFETLLSRSFVGMTLPQLTALIHSHNLSSHNLSYDMCLKIEKHIGIMIADVNWNNCGRLFEILNRLHDLRPKFMQLIRIELAEHAHALAPHNAALIIEFLLFNRVYDNNLLSILLQKVKLASDLKMSHSQLFAVEHASSLVANSFNLERLGPLLQAVHTGKRFELLADVLASKETSVQPLIDSLVGGLEASFAIEDFALFGRSLLTYTDGLMTLHINERARFNGLNADIVRAINENQEMELSQREWALDTLALVVD